MHAFVTSGIDYCNVVVVGAPKSAYRLGHGDECIVWRKWTWVCLSQLRDRRCPLTSR